MPSQPLFAVPEPYVIPPTDATPFYRHNHCPSITWCANGDLLAAWFSTANENGREMVILASRLRAGSDTWEPAHLFFDLAGRNLTGTSLFNDGDGTLYHFNGVAPAEGWANLVLVLRTSTDDGATWSAPRLIDPEFRRGNQVISGTSMTAGGTLIQPCDAVWQGQGGSTIHVSPDGGATWHRPADPAPECAFTDGGAGNRIAGIHAGVVELADGSLLAFGRNNDIAGRMPRSVSTDGGRSWRYSPSPFPPIASGQRLVLMRLREGPLLLVSFTDPLPRPTWKKDAEWREPLGLVVGDRRIFGMFATISTDDGRTWSPPRAVAPADTVLEFEGGGWTGSFTCGGDRAEPGGYLAATQAPDGTVHLVSSRLYYRFNLPWLQGADA